MGCFNMERSLRTCFGSRVSRGGAGLRGAMPRAHRPVEFTNCRLRRPLRPEIPPGGVSLKDCSFRKLDRAGITIRFFVARGCGFDFCNFAGTRFGAGYLGGGEGPGFRKRSTATVASTGAAWRESVSGRPGSSAASLRDIPAAPMAVIFIGVHRLCICGRYTQSSLSRPLSA